MSLDCYQIGAAMSLASAPLEKSELKKGYCYLRSKKEHGAITTVFEHPSVVQGWVIGAAGADEPVSAPAEHINAGFAFCNEFDNFCRDRGKLIASGRLAADPILIKELQLNEKGKLEIVPTLINFLEKTIEGLGIEKQLHVRKYGRGRSFNDGDFLPWLQNFIMQIKDEYKISSVE